LNLPSLNNAGDTLSLRSAGGQWLHRVAYSDGWYGNPVLAAGGIVTGRQMAACMAMGAAGAWTGSVWLTTEEAETAPHTKQKMLAASSRDMIQACTPGVAAGMGRSMARASLRHEGLPTPSTRTVSGEGIPPTAGPTSRVTEAGGGPARTLASSGTASHAAMSAKGRSRIADLAGCAERTAKTRR
jgi:hypothetical protein